MAFGSIATCPCAKRGAWGRAEDIVNKEKLAVCLTVREGCGSMVVRGGAVW
jgi:hypothetical protein